MGDECDKQLNLGNFVFDEENLGSFLDVCVIDFCVYVPIFCRSFITSMCNRSNNDIHDMLRNNCLGSNFIKYSRLYFTFSKAMNKIISTKERFFISLVGPSGSGKSHIFFEWLKIGKFQPKFDKIFYFSQH